MNRVHDISFQMGAISSSSEIMAPMVGEYFGINGAVYPGGLSAIMSTPAVGRACVGSSSLGGLLLDTDSGTKHDEGLAVDWTAEEQAKLNEGIKRYANEPNIMKYIKMAGMLPSKTVRDVALRCRWLTRKRRKPEEHSVGKKICNKKDKLVESSKRMNLPSELLINTARSTSLFHPADRLEAAPFEGNIGPTKLLLEDNYRTFNQITANLHSLKLHENNDLLYRTRNNLAAILTEMRDMPGIMRRMPPLPVSIDDDLASTILPITTKLPVIFSMMYDSDGGNAMKQEPRCC
ncbi:hypothetical protein MLD38_003818 [Melastoma candidum]|uniref:Uncharacterized protein n=1 Tax=Melastoma candidum TaxID=119954 RepID=A0ACB9S3S2_9MYRT|nr:hypothetical protein MLD38_003818 [Melastoma candidum]